MALLIGALFSFVTLGTMRGFNRETILRFSNESLAPTATITLLVGAGGGFGRILQDSGVSGASSRSLSTATSRFYCLPGFSPHSCASPPDRRPSP